MKKLLTIALLGLFITTFANISYSVVKLNIYLANPHIEAGKWTIDVMATVLSGQQWRCGSSNIRVDFVTFPPGAATTFAESPAPNANSNISNNSNYSVMTTTSITGGTAMSLNITRLNVCYRFTPGSYRLGSLRWNRIDTTGCIRLTIRTTSVVQDSITQWTYPDSFTTTIDTVCKRLDYLTGISPSANELPTKYELYQNFPNPFNPVTLIKYDIPRAGLVTITLYDVLGQEIKKLVNETVQPGRYEITWDAKNYASGSYFYKIESGDFTDIKKMILIK